MAGPFERGWHGACLRCGCHDFWRRLRGRLACARCCQPCFGTHPDGGGNHGERRCASPASRRAEPSRLERAHDPHPKQRVPRSRMEPPLANGSGPSLGQQESQALRLGGLPRRLMGTSRGHCGHHHLHIRSRFRIRRPRSSQARPLGTPPSCAQLEQQAAPKQLGRVGIGSVDRQNQSIWHFSFLQWIQGGNGPWKQLEGEAAICRVVAPKRRFPSRMDPDGRGRSRTIQGMGQRH